MAYATSRIVLNDECKIKFLELKTKRNHKFIVFKIEEAIQQVVVEKLGEPDDKYEDLIASLPPEECRYAVFDLDFAANENYRKSKTVFIAWSPDPSRARSKMLYASSKDRFIKDLDGAKLDLQATDLIERDKDNSRLGTFEFEDDVKQAISSATKMSFPLKKLSANSHRSFQDFGLKAESIDFQYMLLGLYLAKFTSILLCGNKNWVGSNGKKVKNCEKIIGSVVHENTQWLKKCAVGWMKKFLPVKVIKEEIKKEGIIILEIRRMGGEMVLLHFDNKLEIERLEEENWGCLLKYFKKIEKWSENLMVTKRSTWISCYGVPIHSWNIDTFQGIANRVGEFVEVDNNTKSMQTFTRGNIHVYTSRKQRIEEWLELQVGNHVYNIRVVEIEPSLSTCCCCGGSFVSNVGLSSSDESMSECSSRVGLGREDEMCRSEVKEQDEACDVEERLNIRARVGSMEFDYRFDSSRDPSSIDSDEVDEDFGEDEEEVWKFNKSLGLYVDCDDNVIIKDFVRIML